MPYPEEVIRALCLQCEIDLCNARSISCAAARAAPHMITLQNATLPGCGLRRQDSRAECALSGTFGCAHIDGIPRIWVSNGCRGVFYCGGVAVQCGYGSMPKRQTFRCACGNGSSALHEFPPLELVHVPKTAGSSLRKSLLEDLGVHIAMYGGHVVTKHETVRHGDENCLSETPKENFRVSLFRSPRRHVLSQYLECRLGFFKLLCATPKLSPEQREGCRSFPRHSSVHADFSVWLRGFVDNPLHGGFGCYSPLNMQARGMTCCKTCDNRNSHFVRSQPNPPVDEAIAAMRQLNVAGITEHYAVTMCLIAYKLGRALRPECFCNQTVGARRHSRASLTLPHEKLRSARPNTHVDVDEGNVSAVIDNVTAVDRTLYTAALARFRSDVREMEASIGRTVLCR